MPSRKRYNILGAYCTQTHEHLFILTQDNINQDTIIKFLGQLRAKHPGAGKIYRSDKWTKREVNASLSDDEIIPYETLIRESGYTPTVRLLNVQQRPAPAEVTTRLHLPPDEELLVVQKLFLADDKPVILTLTHIPPDIIRQAYTQDDFRLPIYEFIPQFCQQEFAYYLSEITPMIATSWLAEQFDLPEGEEALLTFEETGYNQDDQPIVRACSYFRHDLLRLRLIRRLAQ